MKKSIARVAPPQDRITRSDWFIRQHHKVTSASCRPAAIGSAAKANFSEHHAPVAR